jgi:hypothetical protein
MKTLDSNFGSLVVSRVLIGGSSKYSIESVGTRSRLSKHPSEQKLSSTLPPLYGNQPSILAFGGHIDSDNLQASSYPKEVDLHEYLIFDSSAVEYSPISLVRFEFLLLKKSKCTAIRLVR